MEQNDENFGKTYILPLVLSVVLLVLVVSFSAIKMLDLGITNGMTQILLVISGISAGMFISALRNLLVVSSKAQKSKLPNNTKSSSASNAKTLRISFENLPEDMKIVLPELKIIQPTSSDSNASTSPNEKEESVSQNDKKES